MRFIAYGAALFGLPLVVVSLLVAGYSANHPANTPIPVSATPSPANGTLSLLTPAPPTPFGVATRLARPVPTQPTSFPCATSTPNPACDALYATLAAKPTQPPLSAFTITLIVTASTRAVYAGTVRAIVSGPDNPYCVGESWDFGDGKPQLRRTPTCIIYEPPFVTPTVPILTEYARDFSYDRPGTYRVQFCLTGGYVVGVGENNLCATTTIRAG